MIITHFCIKNPSKGNINGTCCVCGDKTNEGFDLPFSDSFTGFSFLKNGNCTCPHCYDFFKNPDLRKKSWISIDKETILLKRLDCLEYILNPPEPPFVLYITKGNKKQGWLTGMQFINFDKTSFYILTDFVGHILINKNDIDRMYSIMKILRENKVSKTQIITGEYNMFTYKKSIKENWNTYIERAKGEIKKPLWEVLCYVIE